MRISAVTPIPVTFATEREPMSFCFVRIDTDEGLSGYGEVCDSYGCSYAGVIAAVITDAFAPLLIGEELGPVELAAQRLRAWTRRRLGDQGVACQARSGVEIALWDLAGRVADRSVSDLLGRARGSVAVYASCAFLEEGSASWHADQLEPLLRRGVRMAKLRVGPDWSTDVATLGDLRGRLDASVELMVDGSEIFTLPTALRIAERLADIGVAWFEEPLPQCERAGIEELVRRSPVPIAYGEHLFGFDDALDSLRRNQLSVLQPDASTCGGIAEARRIAQVASSFGARVVPHVCAGPVSLAANLHLAASVPAIRAIEYPPSLLGAWEALGVGAELGLSAITDGELAVPDGPGIGVSLDEDVARANPYHPPGHLAGVRAGTVNTHAGTARAGFPDRFTGDR
jgi:D-galactarolactone cycloisomerase